MAAAAQTKNSSLTPKAHGLTYVPSNLFQQNEAIYAQYNELREKLFDQCAPQGEMELQTFERRADRALKELRLLQMDRVSATDIQAEYYAMKKNFPIPASLPIAKMRAMSINGAPRAAMTLMVGHSQPRYQKVFKDLIPLKELKRTNPI
jgi:hypothetical protein